MNRDVDLFGYPGKVPKYTTVSATLLPERPFLFVGQVKTRGAKGESIGTGWLWTGGLIITAAHVIVGAMEVQCELNNGLVADPSRYFLHPEYMDARGFERKGSPYDIAVLYPLDDRVAGRGLDIQINRAFEQTFVAGYPQRDGPLVEHSGEVWNCGKYFGHAAHTGAGHSGAPLLVNGVAVGLHLGLIGLIKKWQPELKCREQDGANAALAFMDEHVQFLDSLVR